MSGPEGAENAAAAREARDAVGSPQRRTGSRTREIKAALMRYLTTEQYRERTASSRASDHDDRQDPDTSS